MRRCLRPRLPPGADPEGPVMAALLDAYSRNGRYYDVPSRAAWVGHDAIKGMFVITYNWSNDIAVDVKKTFTDGKNYVLEGEVTGTNTTPLGEQGRTYVLPLGWFDDEGRVAEHHDHWDRKGWLSSRWSRGRFPAGRPAEGRGGSRARRPQAVSLQAALDARARRPSPRGASGRSPADRREVGTDDGARPDARPLPEDDVATHVGGLADPRRSGDHRRHPIERADGHLSAAVRSEMMHDGPTVPRATPHCSG
jgi:hypothetical protein